MEREAKGANAREPIRRLRFSIAMLLDYDLYRKHEHDLNLIAYSDKF
jgi:hypothetical protein